MHISHMMCFSSSIICLLVVTCHGSIINAYESELDYEKDESRLQDNSHISTVNPMKHDRTLSGVYLQSRSSSKSIQKDLSVNIENKVLSIPANVQKSSKRNNTFTKRRTRGVDDDFTLPLPERNTFSDSDPSSQQGASMLSNGHLHNHYLNNKTDSHNLHSSGHHDSNSASLPNGHIHNHAHAPVDGSGINHHNHDNPCDNEHKTEGVVSEEEDHEHEDSPLANFHQHIKPSAQNISGKVWLYASAAVVIISLCGLISVAVVPIMQKWFYHTLLQFLVGLAVGSLSGDGLLHLMPHALLDEDTHDHSGGDGHHHTDEASTKAMEIKAIWRGLAALGGIFMFFIAERVLGAITTYRKQKHESKLSRHPKNMIPVPREDSVNNGSVGEKLAQPKKNSYDHIREKDEKETIQMLQSEASPSKKAGSNQSIHEVGFHGRSSFSIDPELTVAYRPDSDSSVIVSEHHGHNHAHSHEIPQSVSAVAWMVIMGDGLHNFCDGLAIGAAFASGDADGISTTVAVFCHELPHELGDFAMLLKTGMKVKQALFYNGLSSVLCFVGMVIGVSLGNVHSATNWVFAGTAGMFLYIALVDMLPELASPANSPTPATISVLIVQILGICLGISIMLVIALYEHELHSIVS